MDGDGESSTPQTAAPTDGDSTPAANPSTASPTPAAPTPAPGSTEELENEGLAARSHPMPQAQPATADPTVVTPVRSGGLRGIIEEFRDAISGTHGPGQVFTDPDGVKYVKHPDLTGSQKWLKVLTTAGRGAAAGFAAGPGPQGKAKAAQAGIDATEHQQDREKQNDQQLSDQVKQANAERLAAIKMKHDVAAQEFQLGRLKVQASQQDIKFAQEQQDREKQLGSADLGIYKDEGDLARVKQQNPDFWKDVYKNNVVTVPELDEEGNRIGIHLFQRTPGIGSQLVPQGTQIQIYTPGAKPGEPGTLKAVTPTIPMTHDQVDAYNNSATSKMQKEQADKGELDFKASETGKNNALTTEAHAAANKDNAEAQKTKKELSDDEGNDALVKDIVSGRVAPDSLGRSLGSKQGQALLDKVAKADPNLDTSKLRAYPGVYQDFTKGATSKSLNAGGTALKHLAELKQLNTLTSRVPGTADSKSFNNKLDTLVPELIKFYGMPDTNETVRSLKSTLGGLMNRDAAITSQVRSLGDKMDSFHQTWRNAAPSAVYQASMPNIDDEAKMARAELDPKYANRLFSVAKWKSANPQGDEAAAQAAAEKQGMDIVK